MSGTSRKECLSHLLKVSWPAAGETAQDLKKAVKEYKVSQERLIEVASASFDYIIIDSPPMSIMADAEVLAGIADLSVLVVGYDNVLVPDLNDAIDSLRDCKAEFIGCVLNNVYTLPGAHRTVGGYGGYGGYGRYSRYSHYQRYGNYGGYGHYSNKSK